MLNLLLLGCSIFFALNMGGSGFSPAFSAALGAGLIGRRTALLLFTGCVAIGALVVGGHVAHTLGADFLPPASFDRRTALVVIASATVALFVANLVKVPESTSQVTVFAIIAVGLYRGNLDSHAFLHRILPAWIAVPPVAFALTWGQSRLLYPLRAWNYRIYENLSKHEWQLRALVLFSSCYLAVAVGAHVANVVGPLATAGVIDVRLGMMLFAPLFGVGGALFSSTAKSVAHDVAPLGLQSATLINVTVGTLLLVVYWMGIPQSLVHAHVLAVFAIAFAKDGSYQFGRHPVIRRILFFWIVSPAIAATCVVVLLTVMR